MANENENLLLQQHIQQQSMDSNNSPSASSSPSNAIANGGIISNNNNNNNNNNEAKSDNNIAEDGNVLAAVVGVDNVNNSDNATKSSDDVCDLSMATALVTGAMRKTSTTAPITANCNININTNSNANVNATAQSTSTVLVNNCTARSQLTDLVADVCLNGTATTSDCGDASTTLPIGFGDCTNIRATRYGLYDFNEDSTTAIRRSEKSTAQNSNTPQSQSKQSSSPILSSPTASSSPSMQQQQQPATTAPAQNSSTFSFKHFLSSSSSTFTAPSTTVTSLDPICSVASSAATLTSAAATITTTTTTTSISTSNGSSNTQKSTGARPKVPQSASLAIDSIAGGGSGLSLGSHSSDNAGLTGNSTRMKRSPRFSSFDSQASLAEYTANGRNIISGGGGDGCGVGGIIGDDSNIYPNNSNTSGFRLYPLIGNDTTSLTFSQNSKRNANSASNSNSHIAANRQSAVSDSCNRQQQQHQQQQQQQQQKQPQQQQQYVPRSYSSYEMPMQPPMSPSPRRRMVDGASNGASAGATSVNNRPNRLSLHPTNASKLKLDLPIDSIAANVLGPSDFAPASAAALPDFVQDHWMEALYLHDMHLNSPRNSPTRDFGGAAGGGGPGVIGSGVGGNGGAGASGGAWCDFGAIGGACSVGGNSKTNASGCGGAGGGDGVLIGGLAAAGGIGNFETQCLSGDISGIPGPGSNDVTSTTGGGGGGGASKMLPDFLSDGPIIHSSQRLADVAAGLPSNSIGSPEDPPITSQLSNLRLENERIQRELSETRIALCEQTRRANDLERQLQEENRRRAATPTAQQVIRLKQQLAEMAEEAEILRRENEALREDGAVGGFSDNAAGQRGAADNRFVRPTTSRSQQISQALLRAASNAESNLRQLLAGVDNLRQMAADIEDPTLRVDYDGNSDIFSDFLDDCDCFEDFSGGPAL